MGKGEDMITMEKYTRYLINSPLKYLLDWLSTFEESYEIYDKEEVHKFTSQTIGADVRGKDAISRYHKLLDVNPKDDRNHRVPFKHDYIRDLETVGLPEKETGVLGSKVCYFNKNYSNWEKLEFEPDSNILLHLCKLAEKISMTLDKTTTKPLINSIAELIDTMLSKFDMVLDYDGMRILFLDDGRSSKIIDYCSTMKNST